MNDNPDINHGHHPMDKPILRSKFYRLRKIFLRPTMLLFVLLIATIVVIQIVTTEAPIKNAIRNITFRRNRIRIYLEPGTLTEPVAFTFSRLEPLRYSMEINESHLRYDWERRYAFGDLDSIYVRKLNRKSTRLYFTFTALADTPRVSFIEDPPHFELHFNRYLDSLFIIVLDPGHGGENNGAVGPKGTLEKHINLQIAHQLKTLLHGRKDIRIFMTRHDDVDVPLYARREMANDSDADLFLSLHANSAQNKGVNHSEVYYANQRSQRPANIILEELSNELNNGRGFTRRRGYFVIRGNAARIGAVLVETMYLSNATGEQILTRRSEQERIANSLYKAIDRIIAFNH